MRNGPSRSSRVVDFGTNRKLVCDFLLVINSNLGPVLPRFRDIAGFLLKTTPHPYFIRILECSLGLDCRRWVSEERRPYANYSCNYFRSNLTYMPTNHDTSTSRTDTDRQTDGRTDRRATYCSNTAQCTHIRVYSVRQKSIP